MTEGITQLESLADARFGRLGQTTANFTNKDEDGVGDDGVVIDGDNYTTETWGRGLRFRQEESGAWDVSVDWLEPGSQGRNKFAAYWQVVVNAEDDVDKLYLGFIYDGELRNGLDLTSMEWVVNSDVRKDIEDISQPDDLNRMLQAWVVVDAEESHLEWLVTFDRDTTYELFSDPMFDSHETWFHVDDPGDNATPFVSMLSYQPIAPIDPPY